MGSIPTAENPTTKVSKADMPPSEKLQLLPGWKYRVEVLSENLTMSGIGTKGDEWLVAQDNLQNTYRAYWKSGNQTI